MKTTQGPDPIDVAVGQRIRILRRQQHISQTQLADHLGITFQQVQKYEKGSNRISASMLVKAAARLGATVGSLVGEGERPEHGIVPSSTFAKLAVPGAMVVLDGYVSMTTDQRRSVMSVVEAIAGSAAVRNAAHLLTDAA